MHRKAKFSILASIKSRSAIACCTRLSTSLIAGWAIIATTLTVNAATIAQRTTHQPILQSNAPFHTSVTRLEIHLDRRQVVLYQDEIIIKRYPIGTGRKGWETPKGTFRVMEMSRNPGWINPFTNETIPPNDPRNPLRGYWIAFWTNGTDWIGFHGTLDARTVGKAASHGCIHMYDSDLKDLFSRVSLGTQVAVLP